MQRLEALDNNSFKRHSRSGDPWWNQEAFILPRRLWLKSIQKRKIAGIYATSLKDVAFQFTSAYGDQNRRGRVVRDFYDHAIQREETKWHSQSRDSMWRNNVTRLESASRLKTFDPRLELNETYWMHAGERGQKRETFFTLQISKKHSAFIETT